MSDITVLASHFTGLARASAITTTLLGCLLLTIGCVRDDSAFQQELANKSAPVLGKNFYLFYVPASGSVADPTFIALSTSVKPSGTAKQLYGHIARANTSDSKIAVGGPHSEKTAVVIIQAAGMAKTPLPYLHLMFIGEPVHREMVQKAVEATGATFSFSQI